jgi:hypothetical protein
MQVKALQVQTSHQLCQEPWVRRLNPKSIPEGQGEPFLQYRHRGMFTHSPLTMLQAVKSHRAHAIVEQIIADLKAGALSHLLPQDCP